MTELTQKVKQKAFNMGFDLCGIAGVEGFLSAEPLRNPAEILPGCVSVIVVAKRFLSGSFKASSTVPYTILRNLLSQRIDQKTIDLAYYLEDQGHQAVPTGAIEPCNYSRELKRSIGLISLKYAAYQAGLGVIGKNTLLITPEYGNRVWLGAVLTTAELARDPIITKSPCKKGCTLCIQRCPVGALDGSEFIDQKKCWEYAFGRPQEGGEWRIKCFTCRSVCPFSEGFGTLHASLNK